MKDYLNAEERTKHLILLSCQTTAETFSKSEALSEQEKKELRLAVAHLKKFSESVFERMGTAYARKLIRTKEANKIQLVGNYASVSNAITECATEDIEPMFRKLQPTYCLMCEKKDHTKCAMYAMAVALGIQENKEYNGTGCPFYVDDFGELEL